MELQPAPEWETATWLNTSAPLTLEGLRGQVILLHAFQMLCSFPDVGIDQPGPDDDPIPRTMRAYEHARARAHDDR